MDGTEENGAPSLFISMSVSKVHTPNDLARQTVAWNALPYGLLDVEEVQWVVLFWPRTVRKK